MARSDVTIRILGDAKSASKTFAQVDKDLGQLDSRFSKVGAGFTAMGSKLSAVGAKMSLAVTLPVVALGAKMVEAASDLNESLSKVNVVFGESAAVIDKWAKGAAKNMGLSRQAALEAAGTFGNLFKSLGLATESAATMSTELVQLAADLASFNNADISEVIDALRSGMVGETEPLRRFGVSLSAARVEAEALALGLVKPTKNMEKITRATINVEKAQREANEVVKKYGKNSLEAKDALAKVAEAQSKVSEAMKGAVPDLNAAQKAQATFKLIMDDTALAQGDFSRTADGAANSTRILKAQMEDLSATIGERLLPIKMKLLEVSTKLLEEINRLTPAQQNLVLVSAALAAAVGPAVTVLGALATVLGFVLTPVGAVVAAIAAGAAAFVILYNRSEEYRAWVDEKLIPALKQAWEFLKGSFYMALEQVRSAWERNKDEIGRLMERLQPLMDLMVKFLPVAVWPLVQALISLAIMAQVLLNVLGGIERVLEAIERLAGKVASGLRKVGDAIRSLPDMPDLPSGFSPGDIARRAGIPLPRWPSFHDGGVFRAPTPGGEGLALLRDGERVLTPEQSSQPLVVQLVVGSRVLADLVIDDINRRATPGSRIIKAAAVG